MDPIHQIGQILNVNEDRRDAIHIAIVPVFAGMDNIFEGDSLKLLDGSTDIVVRCRASERIGIADPFLKAPPKLGEKFYLWLEPNSVTGMRHHWQHPAFDKPPVEVEPNPAKDESEAWLRHFADRYQIDYTELIQEADEAGFITCGLTINDESELRGGDADLFWHHLGVLKGKIYDRAHRATVTWSCSC